MRRHGHTMILLNMAKAKGRVSLQSVHLQGHLKDELGLNVAPRRRLALTYERRIVHRLPHPYHTRCVPYHLDSHQVQLDTNSSLGPRVTSQDSCFLQCVINRQVEKHGCIDRMHVYWVSSRHPDQHDIIWRYMPIIGLFFRAFQGPLLASPRIQNAPVCPRDWQLINKGLASTYSLESEAEAVQLCRSKCRWADCYEEQYVAHGTHKAMKYFGKEATNQGESIKAQIELQLSPEYEDSAEYKPLMSTQDFITLILLSVNFWLGFTFITFANQIVTRLVQIFQFIGNLFSRHYKLRKRKTRRKISLATAQAFQMRPICPTPYMPAGSRPSFTATVIIHRRSSWDSS